jgi:hypothetical protein
MSGGTPTLSFDTNTGPVLAGSPAATPDAPPRQRALHQSRRAVWIALSLFSAALCSGFFYIYWPRTLQIHPPSGLPVVDRDSGQTRIYFPDRVLIADLAEFDDDLFAYLMFDHYRSVDLLQQTQLMLIPKEQAGKPLYEIMIQLPNDLISGISLLTNLKVNQLTSALRYRWITRSVLLRHLHQTTLFLNTYKGPADIKLEQLHPLELQGYLRRFIRFKSLTDPRVRGKQETVPSPLSRNAASRLAADIIAVAEFYNLPLDLFIGIGAMENNYMNVPGDLENTAWKRRPDPGDIVLRRSHGRVLVRNNSAGVWQITRQSLRYAHRLYLKDKRDYSLLPDRLIPPKKLGIDDVAPETLTTYAGILLRDLLDRYHGDLEQTAGAYNGGVDKPNTRYAAGVEMIASYARSVLERAATLHGIALSVRSVTDKVNKSPGNLDAAP